MELDFYVDPEERRRLVEGIAARGSVRNLEARFRMRDGEVRHTLVSSEVLELGGRRCSLNFMVDITERKRVEEALVASQQITQDIINAIPARVFWKDKDLNYLGCNRTFAADAGFSTPMDIIGKDDFAMGWREQAELYRADDRQVMESGLPKQLIEEPQTTPDGKSITILTSKIPLKGSGGDVIGILGVYLDITARKQAEEEIRSLSRFPDENPNPVLRVEESGKVLYANHASEPLLRMWGCDRGEYLPPDWRQRIAHAMQHETTETMEVLCGAQLYSMMMIPVPGAGYANVYGRDITDSKRTEELIEKRIAALTRPLDGGAVAFEDLFNAAEIQRIQDEFSSATGVASIITRPDGTPLTRPSNFTFLCSEIIRKTEQGCSNCFRSDAVIGRYHPDGPLVQRCLSGGLWDAGASIVVGNRHIANWLIGQVRDETQSEEHMRAYAREIGADGDSFMRAFNDVPAMSREKFDQIARVLFTLAGQLSRAAYQNVQQARFITERQHAEEKIRTLLAEKELLLKEVHHRIKNNMNTMMSLLSLQAGSVKDAGSVVALTDARRRLQSMMVLYDRLYRSDGFRELSIREYLTPLVHEIVGNFPNKGIVNVETHLDDIVLDSKTLAPIGIVVNELLTNAMKHAFTGDRGGSIRISASLAENRMKIAVHDDGTGLPASVNMGTSAGFGLRLVGMLAEQIGGTVQIERDHGTRFTLEFEV
jgi:PAS domain S-box-containing protein